MSDLEIKIQKASACPTCKDYIYKLPIGVDISLANSLQVFGPLMYPLDRFTVVLISASTVLIDTGLGRVEIRIKFLKDQIAMASLFKTILSSWLEALGHTVKFI